MTNLFSVKDKIVLITGSSRGIGYSMAEGFAASGAHVVINGTSKDNLNNATAKIQNKGGLVTGYAFDVTDSQQVEESVRLIESETGPIDVLINNAGIQLRAPLEEMKLENWKKVLDVNLTSAFIVSKMVGTYMISRKKGKIINILSLNAEGARPSIANYSAAKGGLKMLTKSLAAEWGKYNILTNAIGPGYFLTDLTRPLAENPEFDSWVKKKVPLGRWGNPEELTGTAIFLASAASDYINGHTVYVDGGWLACL